MCEIRYHDYAVVSPLNGCWNYAMFFLGLTVMTISLQCLIFEREKLLI